MVLPETRLVIYQTPRQLVITDVHDPSALFNFHSDEPLLGALELGDRIFALTPGHLLVVSARDSSAAAMTVNVTDQKLSYSCAARRRQYNFAVEVRIALEFTATHIASTAGLVFVAGTRGQIAHIAPGQRTFGGGGHLQALSDLVMRRSPIVQLVGDRTRELLFALHEDGLLQAFVFRAGRLRRLRSAVRDPALAAVCVVGAGQSYVLNLAGATRAGQTSFYSVSDAASLQYLELRGAGGAAEPTQLRKVLGEKLRP